MSNEYKDYMRDSAIDIVLEKKIVNCVHYVIEKASGYYIVGSDDTDLKIYFVWLDDNGKWQYEEQLVHNFSKIYNNGYKDGYNDALKQMMHTVNHWREIAEQLYHNNDELITALNEARNRYV